MCLLVAGIPASDGVAITGGPDDVWIGGIGDGEARLAASHVPVPTRFVGVERHTGPAHVPVILHVAVEVVGNLLVHSHVIHLPDGQSDAVKSAAVHGGDDQACIVGDHETIGIGGIDPDVVRVAAPADFVEVLAAIQ